MGIRSTRAVVALIDRIWPGMCRRAWIELAIAAVARAGVRAQDLAALRGRIAFQLDPDEDDAHRRRPSELPSVPSRRDRDEITPSTAAARAASSGSAEKPA